MVQHQPQVFRPFQVRTATGLFFMSNDVLSISRRAAKLVKPDRAATSPRHRVKRPSAIVYPKNNKADDRNHNIEGAVIRDLKRPIEGLRRSGAIRRDYDEHGRLKIKIETLNDLHLIPKLLRIGWCHSQKIGTESDVARMRFGNGKNYDPAKTWLGRFAEYHLPEASAGDVRRAQERPVEPFSNKGRADYLGVTWEMRQRLKLWSFAACDLTVAEFHEKRKEANRAKARERKAAKRLTAGVKPRSQSEAQTKPWQRYGISRKTYYKRKRDGTLIELEPLPKANLGGDCFV
jgi:hypothetical protein